MEGGGAAGHTQTLQQAVWPPGRRLSARRPHQPLPASPNLGACTAGRGGCCTCRLPRGGGHRTYLHSGQGVGLGHPVQLQQEARGDACGSAGWGEHGQRIQRPPHAACCVPRHSARVRCGLQPDPAPKLPPPPPHEAANSSGFWLRVAVTTWMPGGGLKGGGHAHTERARVCDAQRGGGPCKAGKWSLLAAVASCCMQVHARRRGHGSTAQDLGLRPHPPLRRHHLQQEHRVAGQPKLGGEVAETPRCRGRGAECMDAAGRCWLQAALQQAGGGGMTSRCLQRELRCEGLRSCSPSVPLCSPRMCPATPTFGQVPATSA